MEDLQESPSPQLLSHIEQPNIPSLYISIADSLAKVVQKIRSETEPLRVRYDLDSGPWERWDRSSFNEIIDWAETLGREADSATDWLLYQLAVADLDNLTGESTTEKIRQFTDDSTLVRSMVQRRLLGAWLDSVYQQEAVLATFSRSGHEDLIAKFAELDEQLAIAARNEVRRIVFERYPNVYGATGKMGELGILQDQLSRRRRKLSVRRLITRIPMLIQTLKPCVLLSPMAVSKYLPLSEIASETLTFDVVIFDEASQVFPEDSVPAILRGRQLILAGDQKQLPPSSFWRRSMADDEADKDDETDEDPDKTVGRGSILDVGVGLKGTLFREEHLNVHYRSRDESLIRFSNHYSYEDRLLTFPSPMTTNSYQGVYGVYLPEGRYDAAASRTNRIEAERVVDLVFQHIRTRPLEESLGVVALSGPQADLILQLLEDRRPRERDVDAWFIGRTREPFFVKNLENVQGDERDHMIISIGYGPTLASNVVPNRFGPINAEGGERRLNVVVTRAKQRVDLVYSLRPSDIRSQQKGALRLRRYLEYVENPTQAFEGQITVDPSAETESPFESSVERALVARGYRVDRQVGVARYRIDLAILSEDGTQHDLGIECDGVTYHNTPTARDRDWLRQKHLEGLGWNICRVWSTAWARNPEAELTKIEVALATARARVSSPGDGYSLNNVSQTSEVSTPYVDHPTVEVIPSSPAEVELEDYLTVELPRPQHWAVLLHETTENIVNMVSKIAAFEGPVHKAVIIERIRVCYGLGHVRGRTREHLEHGIRVAQMDGQIQTDGNFLWTTDEQLSRPPRKPLDGNIEHVSPNELRTLILATARVMFGAAQQDLLVAVGRRMGFARTGRRVTEVINSAIQVLVENGKLVESFGMLHYKE